MPIEVNDDGAEVDTGTGLYAVKPNHMAPADRPVDDEAEVEPVSEEKSVGVVAAENKSIDAG